MTRWLLQFKCAIYTTQGRSAPHMTAVFLASVLLMQWARLAAQTVYTILDLEDRLLQDLFIDTRYQLAAFPNCLVENASNHDSSELPSLTIKHSNMTMPQYLAQVLHNDGTVIKVTFDFSLLQLVAISEKHESVTISVQTSISWIDCRVAWNPADYGHIVHSSFAPAKFRRLDMYVPEPRLLEEVDAKASQGTEKTVEHDYEGRMRITKEFTTTVSCNFDVSMYPFDTQACNLTFEMQHNKFLTSMLDDHANATDWHEIATALLGDGRFTPSDSWEVIVLPGRPTVITITENCDHDAASPLMCMYDRIAYTLILHRHPTYQLINLMVPAGLVVLISSCVFLIPHGSGDKMGLSLTILLSMFVFTQLMYEKMPEAGSTIPLISQFYIVSILLVSVSCIFSAVITIFAASLQPVPGCLNSFAKYLSPALLCRNIATGNSSKYAAQKRADAHHILEGLLATPCPSDVAAMNGLTHGNNGKVAAADSQLDAAPRNQQSRTQKRDASDAAYCSTQLTWHDIAPLIDRTFFVLHFLTSGIVFTVFVTYGYFPWKSDFGGKLPHGYEELARAMMLMQERSHFQ